MAESFPRPTNITALQDGFSPTEVGVTHPFNPSFMRLLDNGDVEIIVNDHVGMIMSAANHSITFVGDSIRFLTHGSPGLIWNSLAFNENATTYSQPVFLALSDSEKHQLFDGVDNYMENT